SGRRGGRGVFVLVRTSNPGAGLFQDLSSGGKPVYQHVAEAVRQWTLENLGACGLGDVGAVVGATYPKELAALRLALPEVIFLIPGYGAQGGGAKDVASAFREDGLGAVVSSSRAIVSAFAPAAANWEAEVLNATKNTLQELKQHTPMVKLE